MTTDQSDDQWSPGQNLEWDKFQNTQKAKQTNAYSLENTQNAIEPA